MLTVLGMKPELSGSYWQSVSVPSLSPLRNDVRCDVCVVGAGIAGLTTALQLARRGAEVVVVDRRGIAGGETSLTSAHLASALDDGFQELKKWHGLTGLRLAFESHAWAIDEIGRTAREFQIPCEFEKIDGYLFASATEEQKYLQSEFEVAIEAGGVAVEKCHAVPGLASLGMALRFPNQAQFHPIKYMNGLAAAIVEMGGRIFAPAVVENVDASGVTLNDGRVIRAASVVVTTNVPINDRVVMHTKMEACRSYVIALENPAGSLPNFLLWDTAEPYHYVRTYNDVQNSRQVVLVGGEDHKTGQNQNEPPGLRYENLRSWARVKLGLTGEVLSRWSGQVIEPADGLAFIGRNPGDQNIYICTGDSGHGLTHGTIAGRVIADLIDRHESEWARLYDPSRKTWSANFFSNNANTAAQYLDWVAPGEVSSEDEIRHGTGAIMRDGLKRIAVYRDLAGQLHRLSAACPHLQGSVHWNNVEKTWDCPCHGSRFDCKGHVLNGPAISDLEPYQADSRRPAEPERTSESVPSWPPLPPLV